jgi:hypothetical protein
MWNLLLAFLFAAPPSGGQERALTGALRTAAATVRENGVSPLDVCSLGSAPVFADGPPAAAVLWSQDFERPPHRVERWTADGRDSPIAIEITDQRARTGRSSLKLDVLLNSGTYHYWYIPTRALPISDGLVASGWMYIEYCAPGARPALAFNVTFDPLPGSGSRALDAPAPLPVGKWFQWSLDLAAPSRALAKDVLGVDRAPLTLDRLGFFFLGGAGQRVVVYVDDLQVTGRIPPDVDETSAAAVAAAQQVYRDYLEAASKRFVAASQALETVEETQGGPGAQAHAQKAARWRESLREAAKAEILKARTVPFAAPAQRIPIETALDRLQRLGALAKALVNYRGPDQPLVTYVWPAIDDRRVLPLTFPLEVLPADEVAITAAPGEYESATFAIYPHRRFERLTVTASDLTPEGPPPPAKTGADPNEQTSTGLTPVSRTDRPSATRTPRIPAATVDIRWVKCWYQAGIEVTDVRHKALTPELLLRDDDLVRVDFTKQTQWLKFPNAPIDADALQPITLPEEFLKQVWVTVRVPEGTPAGTYVGALYVGPPDAGRSGRPLRLRVTVYPFALPPPCLDYAIYYRGLLVNGPLGAEAKSPQQYEAEMRDLAAHGIARPTCYTRLTTEGLEDVLALRRKADVALDPFLSLGLTLGAPNTPLGREVMRRNVAEAVKRLNDAGVKTLYLYGADEAAGQELRAQRPAFETVRQAGAKVFLAVPPDAADLIGDLLDIAIVPGPLDPAVARAWHAKGAKVYSYANPPCGVEAPARYRRNYGLALWKAGYDGAMNYAYQHGFGDIWDDFDHPQYRDHIMAYPTTKGVIGTVQWEGFREAVDDVRYVTALLAAIKEARAAGGDRANEADQAQTWLDALDPAACDLDAARRQIAERIIALRGRS